MLLLRILVYAASVWVAVRLVDGLSFTGTWVALLALAVILAAVNAVVRPVVNLFSLPLIILTLGLFLLIVNALMLQLTLWISDRLDLGLDSEGFAATFLGALVITIIVWIGEALTRRARS
ncbi:MAG: phage holin family protein [Egibacteraceae bacterium]